MGKTTGTPAAAVFVKHVRLLTALAAGAGSLFLAWLRLGLWRYDLRVPFVYSGDALYETVLVKALTEGTWNYHIARLAAPFGMDTADFPTGCSLDFGLIKILSFVLHNPFLLINTYWLLAIAMAGAFAALFLKSLRLSFSSSVVLGILYGVLPFTFYRNISHLPLVHFIVPVAAYLAVFLAGSNTVFAGLSDPDPVSRKKRWRILWMTTALSAAIGFTYIYWGFFACLAISVGTLIGYFRTRKKALFLTAGFFIGVILLTNIADISASFFYWRQNGPGTSLSYKHAAEADIYGLKIRQLLTPITNHPLTPLRAIRDRIAAAGFPNDNNESATACLGLIGSGGFVFLLFLAIARPRGRLFADSRLQILAGLTLALVLIAEVGGFGSLFNVLIFHQFRGYNRISPFISLFSLAAVALLVDHLLRRRAVLHSLSLGALLVFGLFDQVDVGLLSNRAADEQRFYQDGKFIADLEARLPAKSMVFQLPHTGFPPDGEHLRMGPYEHARAYLHSRTIRWTWGALDGRRNEWTKNTAGLPAAQLVERLVVTGFEGVLIDRFAYPDLALEQEILQQAGADAWTKSDGRWFFISLASQRDKILEGISADELRDRRDASLHPVSAVWTGSFSVQEQSEDGTWRWCGRSGLIRIVNDSTVDQQITLTAQLRQYSGQSGSLTIARGPTKHAYALADAPVDYRDSFMVRAQTATEIRFDYAGPLLQVPQDPRELAFQVRDFKIVEEKPISPEIP